MIKSAFLLKTTIITISLVGLLGCSNKEEKKHNSISNVQVGVVKKMNIPVFIKSFGRLKAGYSTEVKAQVAGRITKKHFTDADYVKKGDLLFEVDPIQYKAIVTSDKANIDYDLADYNLKKYYVEKNKKLAESGAVSKQDFEKLIAERAMAEAKLKVAQAKLQEDEAKLGYCFVKAPINGMTGIDNYAVGDYAAVNDVLTDINDISFFYIDFPIPENNYSRLKKAFDKKILEVYMTHYSISTDGSDKVKETLKGSIGYLNNTADSTSSTITIEAKFDNRNGELLPGQFGGVELKVGELNSILAIPTEAIQLDNSGKYVYVVEKENKVSRVNIQTGTQYKNYTSVSKGKLKAGDKIVTIGAGFLVNGAKVSITKKRNNSN